MMPERATLRRWDLPTRVKDSALPQSACSLGDYERSIPFPENVADVAFISVA